MDSRKLLKDGVLQKEQLPTTIEGCHEVIGILYSLLRELADSVETLTQRAEKLERENAALKERLNQNSTNSSIPPSKSFKQQKPPKPASQKTSGGQPGHQGHHRQLLPSDEVTATITCKLPPSCPCGGVIQLKDNYRRHQVHELPVIKLDVTEYQLEKGYCLTCGRHHQAPLPTGVTWGITGPRLTGLMSHLVCRYRLSRRELTGFLKEQFNFTLSLGSVFNKQKLVTAALEVPVAEVLTAIKQSPSLHVDETSHYRDGKKQWLWTVVSQNLAYFMIHASRGKKVLTSLIGDYEHIVVSDRYAAYQLFDSSHRQVCWAHLKRDFNRLAQKQDPVIARIGQQLLLAQADLFDTWHLFKAHRITPHELLRQTRPIRKQIEELLEQGSYTDPQLKAAGFCKNLLHYVHALWTFLSTDFVEPTNNHAERSIRPLVIWRKNYFGTRSDYGSQFVARTASIIATCKLQAKQPLDFLVQAVYAQFAKTSPPSLLI